MRKRKMRRKITISVIIVLILVAIGLLKIKEWLMHLWIFNIAQGQELGPVNKTVECMKVFL